MIGLLLERGTRVVDLTHLKDRFRLSPRESETVEHLVRGLTTKQVAQRMSVSPNTVKQFVRLVMSKMGVTTRTGIVGKMMSR
jgi:DNA-binding NarL/FixJ family response regulator